MSYIRYVTTLNSCIVYVACLASCQPFLEKGNLALADALHDSFKSSNILPYGCYRDDGRPCLRHLSGLEPFLEKGIWLSRMHSSTAQSISRKRELGSRGCTSTQVQKKLFSRERRLPRTSIVYVICLDSNRFLKKEFGSRGCTPAQLQAFLEKGNLAPAVALQRRFKNNLFSRGRRLPPSFVGKSYSSMRKLLALLSLLSLPHYNDAALTTMMLPCSLCVIFLPCAMLFFVFCLVPCAFGITLTLEL